MGVTGAWVRGVTAGLAALPLAAVLAACGDSPSTAPGPEAAPGVVRTGFIVGRSGAPQQVGYTVHDGDAVIEGDVVVGPAAGVARSLAELERRPPARPSAGVFIDGEYWRWKDDRAPGHGVVYYHIDASLSHHEVVRDALTAIEAKGTGVYFYPRTAEADYLHFVPSTLSRSYVGRQRGAQPVWLTDDRYMGPEGGTVQHEVLHALGLWHEQSRCDRDSYVEVLWANIRPEFHSAYAKHCDGASDAVEYDEASIMHYGRTAFSIGGPTMRSLRGRDDLMGHRFELGPSDVATVRLLYAPGGVPACRPVYPGGPCTPAAAVTAFALVDAATGRPIPGYESLAGDATVDLSRLPTRQVDLWATTNAGSTVGSVRYDLSAAGWYRIAHTPPYRLTERDASYAWTLTPGQHTVTATPYSLSFAQGTAGRALTIRLTVVEGTGPSSAALVSRASGKCADVPAGSREPGTRLAIWPCHGGENQRFALPAPGTSGEIRVYAGAAGALCLDAAGGDGRNGDAIVIWPCHGGANQQWRRTDAGLLVGVNGRCVDVEGGRTDDLTPLLLWDCHGAANQQWDARAAVVATR